MQSINKTQGFTLAEMAIVVVIASILLVAGVKVLTAQLDRAAYSATKTKQEAIRQALITYLGTNRRLPCPDTRTGNGPGGLNFSTALPPDGIENRATAGNPATNCAGRFGVVPYSTLGLARDTAVDGWGNYFSYHHTANSWALSASFADTSGGGITVNDRNPAGAATPLTTTAVIAIVSHGKNGSGAYSIKGTRAVLPAGTDELDNTNADSTYFKREFTENTAVTGGAFDDAMMFVMADDLIGPLRRDGTLQNMTGTVGRQLEDIKNAIVGFMMGAGCNTPANIAGLGLSIADPWGTTIAYTTTYSAPPASRKLTASNATLVPAGTAATVALTLTSYGPNRASGGGDDIALPVTVGQLRGWLGTAYAARCP